MKSRFEQLHAEWVIEYTKLKQNRIITLVEAGHADLSHYKAFLRQCYFNTRDTPIIMTRFASKVKHDDYGILRKFIRHAASETGHHLLAQQDLANLGEDVSSLSVTLSPPTTQALSAFILHCIDNLNPVAYLGYCYHLEALAVYGGGDNIKLFKALGIPENALTFLTEHADADPGHLRLMIDYLKSFVHTQADWEAVLYGLRGSCALYGVMLDGMMNDCPIISRPSDSLADKQSPFKKTAVDWLAKPATSHKGVKAK